MSEEPLTRTDHLQILELYGQACDEKATSHERGTVLIDGLCKMLRATVGLGAVTEGVLPGKQVQISPMFMGGKPPPIVLEKFAEYAADTTRPDLAHAECIRRIRDGVNVFPRQDLISTKEWRASEHYRHYRKGFGIEECLYAGVSFDVQGLFILISLHRDIRLGEFEPRDIEIVHCWLGGLRWLVRQHQREAQAAALMKSLAPRLRLLLAHLQRSGSGKEIAHAIGLSPHSVNQYCKQLYKQFEVGSRPELLHKCAELRIYAALTNDDWMSFTRFDLERPHSQEPAETKPSATVPGKAGGSRSAGIKVPAKLHPSQGKKR